MAWLTGWAKRKSHVINDATGAGANYQKQVVVHYGAGVDAGEDVYLDGKCETDFGDIRFTDNDEKTELDYWLQEKVDSTSAVFWVEVKDSLESSPVTIYVYYGKSGATTTSNGTNTFLFFDDFSGDLSKWTIIDGNFSIDAGRLKSGVVGVQNHIRSNTSISRGFALIMKQYMGGVAARGQGGDWYIQDLDNMYFFYVWDTANTIEAYSRIATVDNSIGAVGLGVVSPNVWYTTEIRSKTDNTFDSYFEGVKRHSDVGDNQWSSGYVGCTNYEPNMYWDDVRVRKYVDPEPAHSTWGSEENAPEGGGIGISVIMNSIEIL